MVIVCTLLVFSSLLYATALECGIRSMVDQNLKKAITTCLSKNMTINDVYDFSNFPPEEKETTSSKTTERAPKLNYTMPIKEMKNRKSRSTSAMKFSRQISAETTTMTLTSPQGIETEVTTSEPSSQEENCILQCILTKMNATNDEGFPEQQKVIDILMKNAKGRELGDFLKDTTENCFQGMRASDPSKNSCDFSKELVTCLANSGESNCGDWPAGDISLFN